MVVVMSAGVRERLCLPAAGSGASSALSVVATARGRMGICVRA